MEQAPANDAKVLEIASKMLQVEQDFKELRLKVQRRTQWLEESLASHHKSYKAQLVALQDICTHKYADGSSASTVGRVTWANGDPRTKTLINSHTCNICNGYFEVELKKPKTQPVEMSNGFMLPDESLGDIFIENLEFNPHFREREPTRLFNLVRIDLDQLGDEDIEIDLARD